MLESFDDPAGTASSTPGRQDDDAGTAELERLSAFEAGYRSGWEDCSAQSADDLRRIGAELERNVQDLGFTYHEARNQLLAEVRSMLEVLFETLLPSLSRRALGERLSEDIQEAMDGALNVPVELVVSRNVAPLIEELLPENAAVQVSLVLDDTLADDQAYLRFSGRETAYDFGELTRRVLAALADAVPSELRETVNE